MDWSVTDDEVSTADSIVEVIVATSEMAVSVEVVEEVEDEDTGVTVSPYFPLASAVLEVASVVVLVVVAEGEVVVVI